MSALITPEHFDDMWAVPPNQRAYPKLPARARIEAAIETLIAILDAADADTDFEETGAEDGFQGHDYNGPGCPISDPGGCEHDGREPGHDAESETWSHPDDHPAELFIGRKQ